MKFGVCDVVVVVVVVVVVDLTLFVNGHTLVNMSVDGPLDFWRTTAKDRSILKTVYIASKQALTEHNLTDNPHIIGDLGRGKEKGTRTRSLLQSIPAEHTSRLQTS